MQQETKDVSKIKTELILDRKVNIDNMKQSQTQNLQPVLQRNQQVQNWSMLV